MNEKLEEKKLKEKFLVNSVKDTAECKTKLEDVAKKLRKLQGEKAIITSETDITSSEVCMLDFFILSI